MMAGGAGVKLGWLIIDRAGAGNYYGLCAMPRQLMSRVSRMAEASALTAKSLRRSSARQAILCAATRRQAATRVRAFLRRRDARRLERRRAIPSARAAQASIGPERL